LGVIFDLIAQRAFPKFQQINSERGQPSREAAFDLQLFLGPPRRAVFSAQR